MQLQNSIIMNIAIYGSRRQHQYATLLQRLLRLLVLEGAGVSMHPKLYDYLQTELGMQLSGVRRAQANAVPADAKLVLSIGGDGTFLRAADWVHCTEKPILGINTGNLGYLTALTMEEAVERAHEIVAGEYAIDSRRVLRVEVPDMEPKYALNEVVVSKLDTASMVVTSAHIDGNLLADYRADGVIVSTPTGSTAYNLSVGGPIVQPSAPVWVVSPIAAHSLSMRPLVVSDDSHLSLCVTGRGHSFRLSVDGRSTTLPLGTTVQVQRASYGIMIVHFGNNSFTQVLRQKLMWG